MLRLSFLFKDMALNWLLVDNKVMTMFRKSFLFQLKTVYWIEKHLLTEILRFEKACSTKHLKSYFKKRYETTKQRIKRIECSFYLLNGKKQSKKYEPMSLQFDQAKAVIKTTLKQTLSRDLGILRSIEGIERIEME